MTEFFSTYVMAPLILLIGQFGNIFGLILAFKNKNQKNGFIAMYKYLFIADIIALSTISISYLEYGLNILFVNKYICKLYWYFSFLTGPISPILIVYISLEKIISNKYPVYDYFLKNKKHQLIFFIAVIAYNSVLYLPVLFLLDAGKNITSNMTIYGCTFNSDLVLIIIDTINRVILPFILMLIASIVLIVSIHRMRTRMLQTFRSNNHRVLIKNIQLTVSIVCINFFYIVLNLPWVIYLFLTTWDETSLLFYIFLYLFNISFACNFYILLLSNDHFRHTFLVMLHLRKKSTNIKLPMRSK